MAGQARYLSFWADHLVGGQGPVRPYPPPTEDSHRGLMAAPSAVPRPSQHDRGKNNLLKQAHSLHQSQDRVTNKTVTFSYPKQKSSVR